MTNSNEDVKPETETQDADEGGHCGGRRFFKVPFIVAAIVLIKSALVLWLWNALVPELFHGPVLTYWQALEVTVLAKLLVGFGGHRHFGGHHPGGHGWRGRWAAMSPAEREKLRESIRRRCGE